VMSESCAIDHPVAQPKTSVLRMNADTTPGWRRCVDEVRGGRRSHSDPTLARGRNAECQDRLCESEPLGTSDRYQGQWPGVTVNELATLKECYRTAAQRGATDRGRRREVHAGHGYLLDQFLWPDHESTYRRYGGPTSANGFASRPRSSHPYDKRRERLRHFLPLLAVEGVLTTGTVRPSTPMQRSSTPRRTSG